jgi:uncharacterized protein (DUF2237 family)
VPVRGCPTRTKGRSRRTSWLRCVGPGDRWCRCGS